MSLTPDTRRQEASNEAMHEGVIAGGLVLVPSVGALYMAMQHSKTFVARTNWQSRTAMAIMPALFVFAFTAETYLHDKMLAIADEEKGKDRTKPGQLPIADKDIHLMTLYTKSKEDAHLNVVPGDKLGLHHRLANYVSTNPITVLSAMAVPSVGLILYGRTGKEHLQSSMKLLHTRIFGQFVTVSRKSPHSCCFVAVVFFWTAKAQNKYGTSLFVSSHLFFLYGLSFFLSFPARLSSKQCSCL